MTPISDVIFAVVDIETTGSTTSSDRIIDISSVTVKDNEIIQIYNSLVNPHQQIPIFIQNMTGITDDMVKNAPEAYDVMSDINNIFLQPNTYFVAHNYNFDWRFICETMQREHSINIDLPKICTLKLARKIIPNSIKKNVGDLAKYFNIPIINRHRAFDDALATAYFFMEMLFMLKNKYNIRYVEEIVEFQDAKTVKFRKVDVKLRNTLDSLLQLLPNSHGVMKLLDAEKEVLHLTKSHNLKEHFLSYIDQLECYSKKISDVLAKTHYIEWIGVESEVEKDLIYYEETQKYLPKYDVVDNFCRNKDHIANGSHSSTFIVLLENSYCEKTVDVFFIHKNFLCEVITVGVKSDLTNVYQVIEKVFYKEELEENTDGNMVKIINNWLKKYEHISTVIYLDNKEIDDFYAIVSEKILNFFYTESLKQGKQLYLTNS